MRLYVKRKDGMLAEALEMKAEIQQYLKIGGFEDISITYGYDITGISAQQLEEAVFKVFANPMLETATNEIETVSPINFTYRFLEGQYDQKADSTETLLKVLFPKTSPKVTSFKHFDINGKISDSDFAIIKKYYINPLEAREISLDSDLTTDFSQEIDKVIYLEGFAELDEQGLEKLKSDYGISMAMTDLLFCQQYYAKEEKNPTITEMKILDTYWSDHCRHSTFLTTFDKIEIEENKYTKGLVEAKADFDKMSKIVYPNGRETCLMDIATMKMKAMKKEGKLDDLEESEEINACSIEATGMVDGKPEDFIIMFKNETHNHPTEMEPFGGAGTCIGGGIRDPLSGRAYVYGAMRITGAADPRESYNDTLEGKLPQRKITQTAALGYSSYGNEIGLAAGHLQEYYDEGFKAKRMECGALVAYNYKKNITRGNGTAGDVIVLVGGKTGRDGIGGATGSSKQQTETSTRFSTEVQKGNPIIERNIIRLFRKPEISKIIKKCNDFGAGGVSVAIGELANSLLIDLDKVPVKYSGLNGTEIAISESQERMAVLLDKKDLEAFIIAAEDENLEATKVADVTDDKRIKMVFMGETICDLAGEFLNSGGVRQRANVNVVAPEFSLKKSLEATAEQWEKNLADLNVASKKGITNQFDKTVGGQTTFYPFGGSEMTTPEQGMAMRLPLEKGTTNLGTIMTVGYNPKLGYQSPFHSAIYAVTESVMKLVSMGGNLEKTRLSFQEYFESMKNEKSWGKVYSALMGAYLVQNKLGIPAIGGKDSMSGTYKDLDVPPSLLSFAVVPCDCDKLVSRAFKKAGNNVYILKTEIKEDGTPDFDSLNKNISTISSLIEKGIVRASSLVGTGGIAGTISQMCFGNMVGFAFAKETPELFDDNYTDVIIETAATLDLALLGKTTSNKEIKHGDLVLELDSLLKVWTSPLEEVFPTNFNKKYSETLKSNVIIKTEKKIKTATPKVLVPVFAGTTGEYTLKTQFEKAGGVVNELLFKTLEVEKSYDRLARAIDNCDVLAVPSGMSSGSVPEAGKMISLIFNSEIVKASINALIERGGIVLGFGEGFKALIDTGLIEHGKVAPKTDSLNFDRNSSNKFYSGLSKVSKVSDSLWLKGEENWYTAIAVLDGKMQISKEDYNKYFNAGQVISAYQGSALESDYGTEGMISPNGQVVGFVGDLSQMDNGLYKNVADIKVHSIFTNIINFLAN